MFFNRSDVQNLEKKLRVKHEYSPQERIYIEKSQKYCKYLRYIPGIQLVAIGNSLSMKSASKESDIDLFIVCAENRIWTVRLLGTLFFMIMGERKTQKKHAWKFCMSFFCSTESLNFSNFAINNDIYLFYWILNIKVLIDTGDTYQKFKDVNTWANFQDFDDLQNQARDFIVYESNTLRVWNKVGDFFNSLIRVFLLPKSLSKYEKLWKPFWVIINDSMLKFHDKDARKSIRDQVFF